MDHKMANLAGIIYPTSFQVTGHIKTMSKVFESQPTFELFRFKNLELGIWDKTIIPNSRKSHWVLLNGFLVNGKSLRQELKGLGYSFHTERDEEVILNAYEAWNEDCLARFNGQFALVIFDGTSESLLLARDRIGCQPLYWTQQGDLFLFASQLKGLLATGFVPQQPSANALGGYLHFGYFPQDLSPIQNVNKLLPGYYLKVDLHRRYFIAQYWSLSQQTIDQQAISDNEAIDRGIALLSESISNRLQKPTTLYLSNNTGGRVLAAMAKKKGSTSDLTATFASASSEELNEVKALSSYFGIPFQGIELKPEQIFDHLVQHVWEMDEPIGSFQMIRTAQIAQAIGQQEKHLCLPHGWQELFAARSRHMLYGQKITSELGLAHHIAKSAPWFKNRLLLPLLRALHLPFRYDILRHVELNTALLGYLLDTTIFHGIGMAAASPYLSQFFDPAVFSQRFHRLVDLPGDFNPSLYFDMKTDLPDNILFQFNHLLNAYSVTSLTPYLDNQLVSFVSSIPDSIKFHSKIPGYLLNQILLKVDPNCPKANRYVDPFMSLWKRAPQCHSIFSSLLEGRLVEEGYLSKKWLELQINHPTMTQTSFQQLWALLILEIWFRLMITNPIGYLEPKELDIFDFLGVIPVALNKFTFKLREIFRD